MSLAPLLASLVGILATMHLWRVQRPVLRERYGVHALATLPPAEYASRLRQALLSRGFGLPPDALAATVRWPDELLLLQDERPVLLVLRVDPDDVVGVHDVEELAHASGLRGLAGGIVTLGHVDRRARTAAPGLVLIDGATAWRWLAPGLPASLAEQVERQASVALRRGALTVWALLIATTVAIASVTQGPRVPVGPSAPERAEAPSA